MPEDPIPLTYSGNPEAEHLWDEVSHPETVTAEWAICERPGYGAQPKPNPWHAIRKPFNRSRETRSAA